MKLIYAKPSPYSRKVRVTLIEKGLEDQVQTQISNPLQDEDVLLSANPLGKVPALVLDDGTALFDSAVICEYLDSLASAPALLETDRDRWTLARQISLADGVLDAAVIVRLEGMRPEEKQWSVWTDRQRRAIVRGLDLMEQDAGTFGAAPDLAQICFGVVLEYIEFRVPDVDWRAGHPTLAGWAEQFFQGESIQRTQPENA